MTNFELAAKCKDIALHYKTVYVLGGFGAPMTASYKAQCVKNYSYNDRTSTWAATADTFAFDCIGIIKGLCWDFSGDLNATYGGAKYASNGVPDVGANMTVTLCSGVTTDFNTVEIGEAVWMDGHIGVYIGDGRILAIARTEVGGKSQFQLTSTDYGETWTVRKTNIFDVGASTPSLIYDPKTGLVSNYYYHRGPGILRCRRVRACDVFDHPESWPASEVLVADGGYSIDSGNANATVLDGTHIVAYYTGRAPDTAVMALPIPASSGK